MNFATTHLKPLLKWTAFVIFSVASFIYLHSHYTRIVHQAVTAPEEVGVSIGYDPATKMMTVTMDGKSELISLTNVERSAFYKQATERVALRGMDKLQQGQTTVR